MISSKSATFEVLRTMQPGTEFSSGSLRQMVYERCFEWHLIATYIRYLREFREREGRIISCINKRRSLYRIIT